MVPPVTHASPARVLVTVSGPDRPGITAELTRILADDGATILDIGQAVIHGLLSLSIFFELKPEDAEKATIKDLLFKAKELGLKLDFEVIENGNGRGPARKKDFQYVLTLIGQTITAKSLARVAESLALFKLNIDAIQRLSDRAFSCVEFLVSSTEPIDEEEAKTTLLELASTEGVDVALQSDGFFRRAKRLVVMDMDSTLIQNEVIDEMARQMGVYDEVARITHEAMEGKMEFDQSLQMRVAKLEGLTKKDIEKVYKSIKLTAGAQDLIHVLKKLGYKIALISGGFTHIAEKLKSELGIDYVYANQLEFKNQVCTGRVIPPIVNAQRKSDLMDVIAQQEGIALNQVIAIGDGANDLQMLQKAGLGIAFNAKPAVNSKADLALKQADLRSIFYLLGLHGREINEALE